MAALVADVTRVESLTEQLGRHSLDEDLIQRTEKNFVSTQISPDNSASDVRISSHLADTWLGIVDRTPTNSKYNKRGAQGIKQHIVSRKLQPLNLRETPKLVNEVRIVKFVSNKRNLRRNHAVKLEKDGREYEKDALNTRYGRVEEGFDQSSSSDDELRELFLCNTKTTEMDKEMQENSNSAEVNFRAAGLVEEKVDKADTGRKRNKMCRGSLKKKIKISRPCLDLEKMEARRLDDLKIDNKRPENIFHPIH